MTSIKASDTISDLPEKFEKRHLMLKISKKTINCTGFATLFFDYNINFRPGQFIMLWIPGIDEKPYTISFYSKKRFGITIEAKGIFSRKAITLEKGDLAGIRGPFGKGFDIIPSSSHATNAAVIAGGCGIAPLATLAEKLGEDTFFIHGAKSKEFILYPERFRIKRHFCTDDGSYGHKGFVTDLFEKEIKARIEASTDNNPANDGNTGNGRIFDMVYACGPEIMMHRVFQICESHDIPCQVSLERYMRCGIGVCGACVCGNQLVCRDGPVFGSDDLRAMTDFNETAMLKSGKAVGINQYVSWRCK